MSDVFISYAREDRLLAESLAQHLKTHGYTVWWDAELVGTDDFYEVILEALVKARACIVIWTKASSKSRFVRDEARFALHHEKLVTVRDPALDVIDVPFGFQSQHIDEVGNLDQVLRALAKLGVEPPAQHLAPASAMQPTSADIDALGSEALIGLLENDPSVATRHQALARLKVLLAEPRRTESTSRDVVRSLTMSNWHAFLSGFTFRAPKFQLTTQGTWTSLGLAAAIVVLTIGSSLYLVTLLDPHLAKTPVLFLAAAAYGCLMAGIAWGQMSRMFEQRNFVAATVVWLALLPLLAFIGLSLGGFTVVTANIAEFASAQYQSIGLYAASSGALLAVLAYVWKWRASR